MPACLQASCLDRFFGRPNDYREVDAPIEAASPGETNDVPAVKATESRWVRSGPVLSFRWSHYQARGRDEGLIGEYVVNSSQDRFEVFSITLSQSESVKDQLGRTCLSARPLPIPNHRNSVAASP